MINGCCGGVTVVVVVVSVVVAVVVAISATKFEFQGGRGIRGSAGGSGSGLENGAGGCC